jgi:hypothetical protein
MPTVAEHEKVVADAQTALDKAKQRQADAEEAARNPRPVPNILADITRWLIARNGNHPVAEGLLKELEAATGLTYDAETGHYTAAQPAAGASEAESGTK